MNVQIIVNGEPREVAPQLSVAGLLSELKLEPLRLAVERNFELVPRRRHAECLLCEGDRIEIVTLVGGG